MPACTREGFAIQEAMIGNRCSSQGEGSEEDQIRRAPRILSGRVRGELVDVIRREDLIAQIGFYRRADCRATIGLNDRMGGRISLHNRWTLCKLVSFSIPRFRIPRTS